MTEYITKGQAVDAAYRAIHYGFNDVHKAMMEGKDLKVDADNFYYTLLENVRAEIAVALPADVVEVVRCKDCKDFRPWGGQSKLGDCMVCVCDGENPFTMEETDFCSDGDRKDDQQCK